MAHMAHMAHDTSRRRVLMITAAWPPVARVGGRRPLRLARRLPALGWDPVVLTPEPTAVFRAPPPLDPSLEPPPVEVLRVGRTVPSTALHRLAGRLPGPLPRLARRALADALLPDQYVEWIPAAIRAARRVAPVDVVWATAPPFGVLAVGAAVAAALDRPLVLDYRDPWTVDAARRRSPLAPPPAALRRLEGALLRRADAVSAVGEDLVARTTEAFGEREKWAIIPNGFDPEDVGPEAPIRPLRPTLLYAGACYGSRSMRPVLKALAAGFGPGDRGLVLRVFGELDPAARDFLAAHPLPGRVALEARVPAATLAGHLRGADALLLLVGSSHRTVPAKLFDYLQAGRPILGYGAPGCAAAEVIARCGVGGWAHDPESLLAALRQVQARAVPFAPVAAEIRRHSADAMAEATAALLDRVVRKRAGGAARS